MAGRAMAAGFLVMLVAGCTSTNSTIGSKTTNDVRVKDAEVQGNSQVNIDQSVQGGPIATSRNLLSAQPAGDALMVEIPAEAIVATCGIPLKPGAPLRFSVPMSACVRETMTSEATNHIDATRMKVKDRSAITITQRNQGSSAEAHGTAAAQLTGPAALVPAPVVMQAAAPTTAQASAPTAAPASTQAAAPAVVQVQSNNPEIKGFHFDGKLLYQSLDIAKDAAKKLQVSEEGVYVIEVLASAAEDLANGKKTYMVLSQKMLDQSTR